MKCLTFLLHTLKKLIKNLIQRIGLKSTIRDDATYALKINGLGKKEDITIQHIEIKSDTITGADSQVIKKESDMLKVFQSEVIAQSVDVNKECKSLGYINQISGEIDFIYWLTVCNEIDLYIVSAFGYKATLITKEKAIYQCLKNGYINIEWILNNKATVIKDLESTLNLSNKMYIDNDLKNLRELYSMGCPV